MNFKRYARQLVLLFCFMLTCSFSYGVKAEEQLSIKASVGYDSEYKLGYSVPVNIEIENKGRNIKGEVQVEILNDSNNIILYAQPVDLPENSKKNFTMDIPVMRYSTKLTINVAEKNKKIYSKEINITPGSSMQNIFIGILSDDFNSVNYINRVSTQGGGTLNTKIIELNKDNFPKNKDVLGMFDVLVINNFDTSSLSKEQYNILKTWVIEGGNLLIGTGDSHRKTLGIFKDEFLSGDINSLTNIETSALNRMAGINNTSPLDVSVLSMDIKESSSLVKDKGITLMHKLKRGDGNIVIAAFDFGLNPIANWNGNNKFAENILSNTMELGNNNRNMKIDMMRQGFYMVQSILRNVPELPVPRMSTFLLIFIIYILIVAPISYFVLKKMDKREMMWITIPAFSLIFVIIMYAAGISTRITKPIANIFSFVEVSEGGESSIESYASVFTPGKEDIKVESSEGMTIQPIFINIYEGIQQSSSQKKEKIIEGKINVFPTTSIEFYNTGVFSNNLIGLQLDNKKIGGLKGEINYSSGAYKGTVVNETEYDLDDVFIITPTNLAIVGGIKAGEKLSIDKSPVGHAGYSYDISEVIYKRNYRSSSFSMTQEQAKRIKLENQKRDMINRYFENNGRRSQIEDSVIIAIGHNEVTGDIIVNGKKIKKYEKFLLSSKVNISFRNGNKVEYPYGYIKPKINVNNLTNGYIEPGGITHGKGTMEMDFMLNQNTDTDQNLNIEEVELKFETLSRGANGKAEQYIWNYEENEWEKISVNNYKINKDTFNKFVKENVLKVKLELLNDESVARLPEISVKGSVK